MHQHAENTAEAKTPTRHLWPTMTSRDAQTHRERNTNTRASNARVSEVPCTGDMVQNEACRAPGHHPAPGLLRELRAHFTRSHSRIVKSMIHSASSPLILRTCVQKMVMGICAAPVGLTKPRGGLSAGHSCGSSQLLSPLDSSLIRPRSRREGKVEQSRLRFCAVLGAPTLAGSPRCQPRG